jgi:hypothetical protein
MKVGFQRTWGHFGHTRDINADLVQQYNSTSTGIPFTVPASVLVYNTPYVQEEDLNYDLGIYGQDQWTFKRLTANAGLRWEAVNAKVPVQTSPAGRFVDARQFAETPDVPNWRDLAPRFGLAYDLFGTGKTAVKFALNRYNASRTTGDANSGAQRYNPLAAASFTLPWTDVNRDDIAQGERGCAYLTAGCEINFAGLPVDFGRRALTTYDPNTKRTWNLESGLEIQHELMRGVSTTVSWYHGNFHNELLYDNQLVTLADWTPVSIFNPIDGTPLTIYNLNAAKQGQVSTLDTSSTSRKRTYDSYGANFNARLPRGPSLRRHGRSASRAAGDGRTTVLPRWLARPRIVRPRRGPRHRDRSQTDLGLGSSRRRRTGATCGRLPCLARTPASAMGQHTRTTPPRSSFALPAQHDECHVPKP